MLVLFGTDNGMRKEIDISLRKKELKIGAHIGELHGKYSRCIGTEKTRSRSSIGRSRPKASREIFFPLT